MKYISDFQSYSFALQTLEVFLKEYKIDICLVSETHCTKESYIKIQIYYIYRTIHPSNKARGGTAVIIKENLKHQEECKYQKETLQATTIKVKTKCK